MLLLLKTLTRNSFNQNQQAEMFATTGILFIICLLNSSLPALTMAASNLTVPHLLPDPETIAHEVQRRVNDSLSRRQMLSIHGKGQSSSCQTGNPIDDCWRCDSNWQANRQKLADCSIGFGRDAMGGKGGQIYVVTDSSDSDAVSPRPGTLRYAVIQDEPLWIVFSADMTIKLKYELMLNSFKTLDGRGANVHITGGGCITLQYVSNVIIHNINIHHCRPNGNTNIRASPTHVGNRGKSDGDGISVFGSRNIWIDHCSLSYCTDGLIDVIMGSTGITISNNYFSHHDEVMLLGHDDGYAPDSGMQVTIAFNLFGEELVQRMPRCRRGYIHVVNNDFRSWEMYAIGGSGSPTINSQGNRYIAPGNPNAKEVTKRVDANSADWTEWNWRTEGDIMVNGAFFVPSGEGLSNMYVKASSVSPKSAGLVDQLTLNAGVFGGPRESRESSYPGDESSSSSRTSSGGGDGGGDHFGMIFAGGGGGGGLNGAPLHTPLSVASFIILTLLTTLVLHTNFDYGVLLPLTTLSL